MKTFVTALVLLTAPVLTALNAAEIEKGFTLEQTLDLLGKPVGTIELRDKTLLLYPEGEVTLREGVVTDSDLMSPEALEAEQAQLQQEREKWLQRKEAMTAKRLEEGRAIKAAKMQSSAFAALPAKDRVDYWRSFQISYPEVDVSEQIAAALEGYETELAELRSQQKIADLEARIAAAEREAAAARLESERLREEAEKSRSSNYGLRYSYGPRYPYRPPTVTIYPGNNGKSRKGEREKHYRKQHRPNRAPAPSEESTAERVSRILDKVRSD